ncbi:MAG TPA: acyl-CoA dehydrogenase family protein [Nitriliruptorales bacterium]|nr:acyl-CoA dehydrogenase family protein [Nitriliruptorales bacterium]
MTDLDVEEIRRIARERLLPLAGGGHPGRVDRPLVRALGDSGLLPRLFPRRLGGTSDRDVSATTLCRLREGLARESTAAETALALQGLGAYPIVQSAAEDAARRWIPPVARGEAVAAFALTEPDAGSDAAAIALTAERDADGWRLSGEKLWISNAPDADLYTVFARTTPSAAARGVTAFVVPGDTPGLGGDPIRMLSPHPIGRLTFDGVAVRPDQVLGEVDHGFGVAMRTLDLFRPSVGAFAVGMAQAALDAAVTHARHRSAFGRPITDFQAVSHQLADMATRIEAARLLVYAAARAYDDGRHGDVTRRAAMAKLFATETAQFVVDAAIQIHGARALVDDHLLAHLYRDVRAPRIYEGTSEIQRNVIARELLRRAGDPTPLPP